MNTKHLGSLYLSLAASIWGVMYVSSKYVMGYIPPISLVSIRFFIAFLFFGAMIFISKTSLRIDGRDMKWFVLTGLVGYSISIGTQFIGTHLSSAHMGSLVTALSPAFILIFAVIILKESITLKQVFALIIASIGVIIISWNPELTYVEPNYLAGIIILVIAAISWGLYSVLTKWIALKYSPLTIQFYGSLFGFIFISPFSIFESMNWVSSLTNPVIWGNILFLGIVSTAGAFYFWNKGFQYMDASKASLYFFLQPVVGTALGWLLLEEEVTLSFLVGGGFVFLGMLLSKHNEKESTYGVEG